MNKILHIFLFLELQYQIIGGDGWWSKIFFVTFTENLKSYKVGSIVTVMAKLSDYCPTGESSLLLELIVEFSKNGT